MSPTQWRAEQDAIRANPESARCCPHPNLPKLRATGRQPYRQRCRTCGAWHRGAALEVIRNLPQHPFARCRHENVADADLIGQNILGPAWRCESCNLFWRGAKPKPFEEGTPFDVFFSPWMDEWEEKTGLANLRREVARREAVKAPRRRPSALAG